MITIQDKIAQFLQLKAEVEIILIDKFKFWLKEDQCHEHPTHNYPEDKYHHSIYDINQDNITIFTYHCKAPHWDDIHIVKMSALLRDKESECLCPINGIRRMALEEAARWAESQAPDIDDDYPDEYRRGQKQGALAAAKMIRRLYQEADRCRHIK